MILPSSRFLAGKFRFDRVGLPVFGVVSGLEEVCWDNDTIVIVDKYLLASQLWRASNIFFVHLDDQLLLEMPLPFADAS